MTDYNKLKVADLRALLKDRAIPSTGLTRKAQIVEKLQEHDQQNEETAPAADTETEKEQPVEEPVEEPVVEPTDEAAASEDQTEKPKDAPATTSLMEVTDAEPPTVDRSASMSQSEEEEENEPKETVTEPVSTTAPVASPAPTSPPPPSATATATATGEGKPFSPKPTDAVAPSATETVDFAPAAKMPSPAPNEKPSVERLEPPPLREQSTDSTSATASQLDPKEVEADTRKRKRRSQTPDIPLQDIKAKKHRPSDSVAPEVHLKEDDDVVMEQRRPEEEEAIAETAEANDTETSGPDEAEKDKDMTVEESDFAGPATDASDVKDLPVPEEKEKESTVPERKTKDARYKDIFKPAVPDRAPAAPPAEDEPDNGPVDPALHAATPGLYIRDLMRPLKIESLRAHLILLATPRSSTADPEILKSLFLDSMKTHAFVLFSTTNAASRVRATLHNTVWPPEGQRKPLFIDFVPADKITDWIREEEEHISAEKEGRASSRPIPSKRFEVVYPTNLDTGAVEAVFQEVGARRSSFNPPKGPRSNIEQRRGSPPAPHTLGANKETAVKPARDLGKSFQTLEALFDSTTAKPKLYYLPVSDRIADRRLDDLDAETSPDWRPEERVRGRGAGAAIANQKMRYSFDDDDRVVQVGGDFGPWADDSGPGGGGYRGGYRGGRGGGFRSDFAPRGGYGGGGGGYRGRGGGGSGYRPS